MTDQLPRDYETLTPYFNTIRRIRKATIAGVAQIVTVTLMIAPDGQILHTEPETRRLEPQGKTIEIKDT